MIFRCHFIGGGLDGVKLFISTSHPCINLLEGDIKVLEFSDKFINFVNLLLESAKNFKFICDCIYFLLHKVLFVFWQSHGHTCIVGLDLTVDAINGKIQSDYACMTMTLPEDKKDFVKKEVNAVTDKLEVLSLYYIQLLHGFIPSSFKTEEFAVIITALFLACIDFSTKIISLCLPFADNLVKVLATFLCDDGSSMNTFVFKLKIFKFCLKAMLGFFSACNLLV